MDREGVCGCREKRAYFLEKLDTNAALYNWYEKIIPGVTAGWEGKPLTLAGLFDEAVRRAEEKITSITVNCDIHGAGDALIMAWVAEGSRGFKPECKLFARGAKRELLEAFGQEVTDDATGARDTFRAYAQEMEGRGCGSRVWQRGNYLGFKSAPKRPRYVLKDTDDALARITEGGILIFPNTADGSREWPPFYWIELFGLLESAGLKPHIVTPIHDTRYSHLRSHCDYRWPEVMAAMLRSKAVVCNDSGPMHIAGTLDVLTFALLGPTTETIHNHMPSVVGLAASKEDIDCIGCHFQVPYCAACKSGCSGLSHLLPQSVFSSITERLAHAPRPA